MAHLAVKKNQDFETLYDEYYDKVFVYILYRARSRQDAEDLTADVFMRALAKPYDPQLAGFSTYIFTIAANALKNYCRDAARHDVYLTDAMDLDIPDNADYLKEFIGSGDYGMLKAALYALPQRLYDVIYRRYYLEEGFREIGAAIGVSENNARQLHFSAIKKLKEVLK